MTAHMSMTMTGGKELARDLRGLPKYVRDECLEDATVAGGLVLINKVKSIALGKHILRTGQLIRSYHLGGHTDDTPDFDSSEAYGDIGGEIIGNDSYELLAGTNLSYARRQEFGFEDTDSRGHSYHQPARPHLRPAFDESATEVVAEMAATLRIKLARYAKL